MKRTKHKDEKLVHDTPVSFLTPLPQMNPLISINEQSHAPIIYGDRPAMAEFNVDHALRQLDNEHYVVFRDLIIPSGVKSLPLTQIDHVVISIYGIFCIETKSNNGSVYGFTTSEHWKQYLGRQQYGMYNPYRQNEYHAKSLENLLHGMIKAPIHSYIAFPNAYKVIVDGKLCDMSIHGIMNKINQHTRPVYDLSSVERIAKTLAYAASKREELRPYHIAEVRKHVESKISHSLKVNHTVSKFKLRS